MTGLLIFDCDGVLVDTERVYNRAWAEVLPDFGVNWSAGDCARNLMGRTLPDCLSIIATATGRPVPEHFLDVVFAATDRLFAAEGLLAVEGIADTLAALPHRKCVASSGVLQHVRANLERTQLLPHFDPHVFVGAMVPRSKPAPDLFLHAAATMGVPPQACVVIEDSLPGVQGARAAGMRVLGYARQHYDRSLLEAAGAELFDDMRVLPALIGEMK